MRAKKHLGQNFLKSKEVLKKILLTSNIKDDDLILEIGPGKGALTEVLLSKNISVIAIEKDESLIPILETKFDKEIRESKLKIIKGDILKYSPEELGLKQNKYKLVANIPYYITGEIIKKFLETDISPSLITLLVQKEVAERIVAKNGKESVLSISVKVFGEPFYIKTVSKKYFSPTPKVDSAIISIIPKENILKINNINPKDFFIFLKRVFNGKRKIITNCLKKSFKEKEKMKETLEQLEISEKERPEDIYFKKWVEIFKHIKEN